MTIARIIVAVSLLGAGTGCLEYAATAGVTGELFAPLQRRDLPGFEQQITLRQHTGVADGWTRVADAWLAYANCERVEAVADEEFAADESVAAYLHATVVAEDARRRMLVGRVKARGETIGETAFRHIHAPGFFERRAEELDSALIRWPAEQEGWVDEVPAPYPVDSVCAEFVDEALRDGEGEQLSFQALADAYLTAVAAAARRYDAIPPTDRDGALAVLDWRLGFYAARVVHSLAGAWNEYANQLEEAARAGRNVEENREKAGEAASKSKALRESSGARLANLIDSVPSGVDLEEAGRARLLYAFFLLEHGKTALALSMLASVRDVGLRDEDFWTARYLELRVSSDAARWTDAARLADAFPPATSPVHPAYYYRVGVALQRTGARDQFLQTAMKAFRDRPYKSDPFLRALYVEMLETLGEYPFEARIVEMLEDLGPRGGIYERVEEYARTALDRGRTLNADAAAAWLLARDSNARHHPRYHAIRALAAFLDDDEKRFERHVADVIRRPADVLEAVPATRRSTFFAHADTELARILRQMLPVMAEWGEAKSAQDRRQRWLKMIVSRSQEFLRSTDDTLVRPQLTELYRLASGLLAEHPRGYVERVGQEEPAPIVLGTVRVERRDLEKWEPTVVVSQPEPFSLTLLPVPDLPPAQWPFFWELEVSP